METPSLMYSRLNEEKREMRLLSLQSGDCHEEITCQLVVVSLDDPALPGYEALSYVWGSNTALKPISLNNSSHAVTSNLFTALARLRHREERRTLWIDALCINQSNQAERSSQIAVMGEVYSRSESTIAWLGEFDGESLVQDANIELTGERGKLSILMQPTMKWAPEETQAYCDSFFAAPHQFPDWPVVGALLLAVCYSSCNHLHNTPLYSTQHSPFQEDQNLASKCEQVLLAMFDAPYWTRIWILQETVLAPSVNVQIGRNIIPFRLFELVIDNLELHLQLCCAKFYHTDKRWKTLVRALARMKGNISTRRRWRDALPHTGFTLSEALDVSLGYQATLANDHIYGLLGLLKQGDRSRIPVSYETPVDLLFTNVTFQILQQSNSLKSFVLKQDDDSSKISLRSWVRDWSKKELRGGRTMRQWDLYNASKSTAPYFCLHQAMILEIRAKKVCTVTEPFAEMIWPSLTVNELDGLLASYLLRMQQSRLVVFRYGGYRGRLEEVLWRTIIRDSFTSLQPVILSRRTTSVDLTNIEKLLELYKKTDDGDDSMKIPVTVAPGIEGKPQYKQWGSYIFPQPYEDIKVDLVINTLAKQLFLTDDGRLGSGPFSIESQAGIVAGDEVYLAAGSRMPLLLRRAGPAAQDGLSCAYTLIGVCYVHGMMDGEAIDDSLEIFRSLYLI